MRSLLYVCLLPLGSRTGACTRTCASTSHGTASTILRAATSAVLHPVLPVRFRGLRHLPMCAVLHVCLLPVGCGSSTSAGTRSILRPRTSALYGHLLPSRSCGLRHLPLRASQHLRQLPIRLGSGASTWLGDSALDASALDNSGLPRQLHGLRQLPVRATLDVPVLPSAHRSADHPGPGFADDHHSANSREQHQHYQHYHNSES